MRQNFEFFEVYAVQKRSILEDVIKYGKSQVKKSIAWHAAKKLKTNFTLYQIESSGLKKK